MRRAARAPLVVVADVWVGARACARSPGSLLLRLAGFGRGCADARGRQGPLCGGSGCLGGPRVRAVSPGSFAIAACGLRSWLSGCALPPVPLLWL